MLHGVDGLSYEERLGRTGFSFLGVEKAEGGPGRGVYNFEEHRCSRQ